MPRVLHKNLLCELMMKRRLALCLDYDGTIAPIVSSPEEALPPPEIRELMGTLVQHPEHLSLVVASGRRVKEVQSLLALEGPSAIIGTHGLEVMDWVGQLRLTSPIAHCLPAMDKMRDWLNSAVSSKSGFFVEDKMLAVAFHYRNGNHTEAANIVEHLKRFVRKEAAELKVLHGEHVIELVPRVAPDKGFALLSLLHNNDESHCLPAYFSDDLSDEGAFYKVRQYGITVLVGPERPSYAEFRIERSQLLDVLTALVETLGNHPRC
jgi:trehalose-phosphatase